MVIEYAGNVIRSILTDKREKYYDSKVSERLGSFTRGTVAQICRLRSGELVWLW